MFLELLVNPIKEYKYTYHNFIMINNRIINNANQQLAF